MNRTRTSTSVKIRNFLIAVATMAIFGCLGGSPPQGGGLQSGIYFGDPLQVFADPINARGETLSIPVTVRSLNGGGTDSPVITPTPIPGVTFSPASTSASYTNGGSATVTFQATIGPSAQLGDHELRFTRTGPSDSAEYLTAATTLTISNKLASATFDPTSINLEPGQTKTLELSILPRGDSEGPVDLQLILNGSDLTLTPRNLTAILVKNSTTAIRETVTVFAAADAADRSTKLRVRHDDRTLCEADVIVGEGTTDHPGFMIIASPTTVTAASGGFSENVHFSVRSVNGFSGDVKVTWVTDGGIVPEPVENDFVVHIEPNDPAEFNRTFRRNATHNVPLPITFNVTDIPFTKQESVTITVNGAG